MAAAITGAGRAVTGKDWSMSPRCELEVLVCPCIAQ